MIAGENGILTLLEDQARARLQTVQTAASLTRVTKSCEESVCVKPLYGDDLV